MEISSFFARNQLKNYPMGKSLLDICPDAFVRGFRDSVFRPEEGYICGIRPIKLAQLIPYQLFFENNFGLPVKDLNQAVLPGITFSLDLVPSLNRMHSNLLLGVMFLKKYLSLEDIAKVIHEQQRGGIEPPVNLGDKQILYAKELPLKKQNNRRFELAIICPHLSEESQGNFSIDYMVHTRAR